MDTALLCRLVSLAPLPCRCTRRFDTEEVAGSNPVVPTNYRFKDILDSPMRLDKPLEKAAAFVFLRPNAYHESQSPVGVFPGVRIFEMGVFLKSGNLGVIHHGAHRH